MRLTQFSVVLFTVASATLAACGGDDGPGIMIPDAKVWNDAPVDTAAAACKFAGSYQASTVGDGGAGSTKDWIRKGTQGALNGLTYFGIYVTFDDAGTYGISITIPRPDGTGFVVGDTYTFVTTPTNDAVNQAVGIQEDANMDIERLLWASSGSITFQAVGQNANDPIMATMTMTNLREVDDNGADIAGGCVTSIAGLTFNLKQLSTIAAAPPPSGKPADTSGLKPDWATLPRLQAQF